MSMGTKFILERLDTGFLVTAEDPTSSERHAFVSPQEAILAISLALGVRAPRETPLAPPRAPAAPSPDDPPDVDRDNLDLLLYPGEGESPSPAAATRRIGLLGASKRPGRPPVRHGA